MEQMQPDLWETDAEFPAPGLSTHAYVLTTPAHGNLLIYNTTSTDALDAIERLGGLTHQYLSHQDEVAPSLRVIKERFGSVLHGSRHELDAVATVVAVDAPIDDRGVEPNGLEVIPTPGHSPGSTSFAYRSPHGKTYLFTGDTLYVDRDGRWRAGFIPGVSQREPMLASLQVLAELEPDVVISSAFTGDAGVHEVDRAKWAALVDEAAARLAA